MARRLSGKHASSQTSARKRAPPFRATATRSATSQVARRKPSRKPRYKLFHQIVEHLRELLPAPSPVDVRLGWPGHGCYGVCKRRRRRYAICVSSRLKQEVAIDVLIHEWAHALAYPRPRYCYRWQPYSSVGPIHHDAAWGQAYAKVYSAVLFDILPRIRRAEAAARRLRRKGRGK